MDVKADTTLTLKFPEVSSYTFWLSVTEECPVISEMVLRIMLPFSTLVYLNWGFH
jgi:hypothetical protein